MKNLFDYIYYRVCKFYFKTDGISGQRAIIVISMLQTITLANICIIFIKYFLKKESVIAFSKQISYLGLIIFFILNFYNHYKYKNKYLSLRDKWKDEALIMKNRNGWLVVLALIIPWIVLFFLGFW